MVLEGGLGGGELLQEREKKNENEWRGRQPTRPVAVDVLATLSGHVPFTFRLQTPGTRNPGSQEQRYAPDTMKETMSIWDI